MTVVILNGEERDLPAGATVEQAVAAAGASSDGRGVAVALDGEVVPRGSWASTTLGERAQVEVLHAVQGGS